MEPEESVPSGGRPPEPRRPLLMDPAGARPSGFAPPAVLTPSGQPAPGSAQAGGPRQSDGAAAAVGGSGQLAGSAPLPAPAATAPPAVGPPSKLAAAAGPGIAERVPGEASFGPVSQVVRVSVRTLSSRIDLVLPDRSTIAETLETVLELAPRSLREQAIAHGGWILRTAAGAAIPGSTTLLDEGIVDGSTLFLSGLDAAGGAAVYDDVADAVADTVRTDPSAWPPGGGRTVALGAAGVFAALTVLTLVWAGPPWGPAVITLAGLALLGQLAAGLLSRGFGDAGVAVPAGLLSVAAGAAAVTLWAANPVELLDIRAGPLLLGAATAGVLAATAALAIGSGQMPFVAVVTGSVLVCIALGCCALFDLAPVDAAAIVAGLALSMMPLVPSIALLPAGLESAPLPGSAEEVLADHETVDTAAVVRGTRQAVGSVTALIQGLAWPALVACVVLAVSHDLTAELLAGAVAGGLILRSRLFITIGQRLPLLLAGIGGLVVLLLALMTQFDGSTGPLAVAAPALLGVVVCLVLAARRRRPSPGLRRAAEIIELLIAVAVVPLVAGVLGLFGYLRGLGG